MTPYPHLPGWSRVSGLPCYVFDKLDGSNVSCLTDRKGNLRFYKRGTLLDDSTPFLAEARTLIPAKYGESMARLLRDQRWDRATFFFEFYGPTSSFGWHAAEPHTVTLFDIHVERKGFLEPKEFVKLCRGVETAPLLHVGNFTKDIADAVSNGTLEGMTFEGVVCKGAWDKKLQMPRMFKWKNLAWLKALREKCGDDEKLFESLA